MGYTPNSPFTARLEDFCEHQVYNGITYSVKFHENGTHQTYMWGIEQVSHFIGLQKSPPHFTVVNEYWFDEGIKQLDNCFWFCTLMCVNVSQESEYCFTCFLL